MGQRKLPFLYSVKIRPLLHPRQASNQPLALMQWRLMTHACGFAGIAIAWLK